MSKFNVEQKNFIKSFESKKDRKEVKKIFKKCNKEKDLLLDSVKVLRKFFKSISPNKVKTGINTEFFKNKYSHNTFFMDVLAEIEFDKYKMTDEQRLKAINKSRELRDDFDKKQELGIK